MRTRRQFRCRARPAEAGAAFAGLTLRRLPIPPGSLDTKPCGWGIQCIGKLYGKLEFCPDVSPVKLEHLERTVFPIVELKATAEVGDSKSMTFRPLSAIHQSDTAVGYSHNHVIAELAGFNEQVSIFLYLRQAMHICIFDNRLQDHSGDESIVQLWVHRYVSFYPVCIASVLHGEVDLEEVDFISQGYHLHGSAFQTDTQQAAQLFKHFVGGVHVGSHEAWNAIHGVEKEVRI